MRTSLLLVLILFISLSCSNKKSDYLPIYSYQYETGAIDTDRITNYILKTDSGFALPVHFPLPDSLYICDSNLIAEEDDIIRISQSDSIILHLKGDTLQKKGDTIHLSRIHEDYSIVELLLKNNGVYIKSKEPLRRCQINICYTQRCLMRSFWKDQQNIGLDFQGKEKDVYIYYSPYSEWESGCYNLLKNVVIMYYLESKSGKTIREDEISLCKEDFGKYFDLFKAYLIQQ